MSDYAMVRLSRTMSIRSTCVCALCFMFFTCLTANGFNLNLRHALVFSDPTRQVGSYFGFTVALRKHEIRRWLVVGAPRGNSTYPEHRGIHQPGVVYQCRLDKGSFCQHLVLDSGGNREVSGYDGSPVQHKRDDSWLGGAIAVQDNGERLLVCAPRWRNSYYSENYYLMNGACYLTDGEIFLESKKETLLPLSEIEKQFPGNHYMYVFGQAGFSAHFPKNSTEFLLGAPGVFYWKGAIIRYRAPTFYGSGIRTEGSTDISDPLSTSSVPTYGYLGYSLSSGRFLSARSSHLYVAGSPRNDGSRGKVYVFDFPHTKDQDLKYIRVLDGTQMGEYFGGALCVVDLNGDNLDDLVVAAPQFSLQAANSDQLVGDEGRIYVFINYDDGKFMEITGDAMIMGSGRYGARFGTAVANVGDLNMDGYEDIAVGAPYEKNGVVYIYHGCADGIKHKPVQIVQAENIDPRIKGFGISLSKGLDIDENHYNDVAVGAFKSGHAVVLRSHPVITFKPTLTTSTRSVSHKMFKFSCTACLAYTGWHVPNTVDAKVTMQVDLSFGRANFVFKDFSKTNTYSYNTTLQRDTQWCKDLEVENAQRAVGRTEPLLLVMVYELANVSNQISQRIPNANATDEFCVECPVLDITQPNTISTMVAFETGCKSVVCKPDLYIDARFIGIREKFIHGEKPTLQMKVEVKNKGEPAFLTRVTVVVPKATPIVEIPPICHELSNQDRAENYTLICDIGYPLEKNYTMDLLMSMRSVPVGTKKLVFAVNVTSVGNDVNPDDNHKELVLPLGLQADMTITGVSSQDQIAHLNKEATYVEDLMLYHTFQVWNLGPSTVERAEIEFQIPHQYIFPTVQEIFMRILEPKLQASTRITCTPVMGFTYWNPSVDIPTSHPVLPDGEELGGEFNELINRRPLSVSKRSIAETESRQEETFVDSTSKTLVQDSTPPTSNFSLPPSNRTLFLNCTNPKVDCFIVKCSGGPFLPNKTRAVINFQLRPDLKILDSQLEMKDIILFSSLAKVTIREPPDTVQPEGHKPDHVDVHTMFFGKIPESTAATWIIVLAIITGVLLLLLITMALHKIGFFHRQKKEDLQALKEAEVPPSELEGRTNFQTEVISSDEL